MLIMLIIFIMEILTSLPLMDYNWMSISSTKTQFGAPHLTNIMFNPTQGRINTL